MNSNSSTTTTTTLAGDQSLLSLSIAASSVAPMPLSVESIMNARNQRRLSSAGKTRRRLSDARDAAAAVISPSLATLSLEPEPAVSTPSTSAPPAATVINSKPISIKNGKKRGMEHKCEGCSKVYRHPSCLIKHRWEHTPHWRESSKYVLSKHQQVQLLEAAAILSHFSPTGTSLPEDRSLWPSFLSGGSLPLPEGQNPGTSSVPTPTNLTRSEGGARAPSVGPRLHDYAIPSADVTQVRPGLYMMGGSGNANDSVIQSLGPGIGYGRASSLSSSSSSTSGRHTSTLLSIPRSSLRSGSVLSEGERSRSSSEEDEEDEESEERMYHDYEFEADMDVDADGGLDIRRNRYTNSKKSFDEYGFKYERGLGVGVKVATPTPTVTLNPMKEEDWEMEMDMD